MKKVNRNEPCPCGSGKKYKNCHQKVESVPGSSGKGYLIGAILLIFVIIAGVSIFIDSQPSSNKAEKPPGPAPAGKVWSPEHGHYH